MITKQETAKRSPWVESDMKEVRKRVKNIRKPYVMKDKNGLLYIIYNNRVEFFRREVVYTKSEMDKENPDTSFDYEDIYGKGWNKEHEKEMASNNGFRQVGIKDEVENE